MGKVSGIYKGSLSDIILLTLEKTAEGMLYLEEFTYSGQMRALKGLPPKKQDTTLVMAIRRLRAKRLVETENDKDGNIILRLTSVGNEYLNSKKNAVWDGKYRIVIWDIPENKRTLRNLLRRKIKDWGFVPWQKSVLVSKRDVTVPLRSLINDLGIEKWVSVIESEDESLKVLFKN